ncbi:MAG: sigma-54-dependent transcriptional regulator [Bryobacteraceae bacterium]
MLPAARLVAVDDDAANLELLSDALAQEGLEILTTTDPAEGWELVRQTRPDIAILDLVMPGMDGMELLEKIVDWDPGIDVILLTGHYSTESAVTAIRKGACDYLTKPVDLDALSARVSALVGDARRRREAARLEGELLQASRFEGMVGRGPQMLEVFAWVRRVAPHYRVALVRGETGTGKELVAQALHRLSPAAQGRFVVCNCSAVVETLFESELFGHVRGAFTGAVQDRVGLFEYANGGTLFLDEIGDLPQGTQSKLLRALQSQEVQRVGSPVPRSVDVRVVAATNRDLNAMMAGKQFRDDLYYRLSMVEIEVPRLADRKQDLPLLANHFLERFAAQYGKPVRAISRRAHAALARYHWPGNVRQLENVIGHACMMAEGETIDIRDLPAPLRAHAAEPPPSIDEEPVMPLEEAERRYVLRVLEHMGGNKVRTAKALGISRATLYRILGEAEGVAT